MDNIISKIKHITWRQRWAGSYTFISCSFWGRQYFFSLKRILKIGFSRVLFTHKEGVVSFYVQEEEFDKFGKYLAKKTINDKTFANIFFEKIKKNTDSILSIMKKIGHKIPSFAEYTEFLIIFERHLAYHNFVKKTVDFLDVKKNQNLLKKFLVARVYSETVYSDSESFFRGIMEQVGKKEKIKPQYLTCLTKNEFEDYLRHNILPKTTELQHRFKGSVLYFQNGKENIIKGKNVSKIETFLKKQYKQSSKLIRGVSVYPGVIKGVARVILDPHNVKQFNQGDILVTGMTRPEFLPLIKKASAIITDVGGVLCHAAITAREMKIPCVVGTQSGSKIIKTGNFLNIDAAKGLVKVIKD